VRLAPVPAHERVMMPPVARRVCWRMARGGRLRGPARDDDAPPLAVGQRHGACGLLDSRAGHWPFPPRDALCVRRPARAWERRWLQEFCSCQTRASYVLVLRPAQLASSSSPSRRLVGGCSVGERQTSTRLLLLPCRGVAATKTTTDACSCCRPIPTESFGEPY
jgi:hypothetical protein